MEVATASAPHESQRARGRPERRGGRCADRGALHGVRPDGQRASAMRCCATVRRPRTRRSRRSSSAHRALLNGTEPREPAAWLATIARNECWARIRTRMREPLPAEELETAASTNDPLAEAIRQRRPRGTVARDRGTAATAARRAAPARVRRPHLRRALAALAVSGAAVESLLFRARQLCAASFARSTRRSPARRGSTRSSVAGGRRRRPRRGEGRCARGRRGGYRRRRGRRAVRLRQPPAVARAVRCPLARSSVRPKPRRADQGADARFPESRTRWPVRPRPSGLAHARTATTGATRRGETQPAGRTATAATRRVPSRAANSRLHWKSAEPGCRPDGQLPRSAAAATGFATHRRPPAPRQERPRARPNYAQTCKFFVK